jgi:hypothetical protein
VDPDCRVRFLVAAHVRLVQGHDAAELVKIRYNFACVVVLICEQSFRSFTGTADTSGLTESYVAAACLFRLGVCLAWT